MLYTFEEYGFYLLAYFCYKNYGIITDQKWFDEHVLKVLNEYYPTDLANNTFEYMKIEENMNNKISSEDFSGLTFPFYNEKYNELYSKLIYYTRNIEHFLKNNCSSSKTYKIKL